MEKKDTIHDLIIIVVLVGCLIIFISLTTHEWSDYREHAFAQEVQNKCGRVGALISHFLFRSFGYASYVFLLMVSVWMVTLLLRRKIRDLPIKIFGCVLLAITACTIASLMDPPAGEWTNQSMPSYGGQYGLFFKDIIGKYFGKTGSLIIVLLTLASSLVLATDWLIVVLFRKFLSAVPIAREAIEKRRRLPRKGREEDDASGKKGNVTSSEKGGGKEEPSRKPNRQKAFNAEYVMPSATLLDEVQRTDTSKIDKDIKEKARIIEETLKHFDVEVKVVGFERGPVVTKYELELAPGIRVHKVMGMGEDLGVALKTPSVRVVAPIPGKSTIALEVANSVKEVVRFKEIFESANDKQRGQLPLFLGRDVAGKPIIKDLAEMPHLLIAGTTGSGKSVCISTIIMSLLMTKLPRDLRLILIDPKMVELSQFHDIPHLCTPVITETKKVPAVFGWLVKEVEERYDLFARTGVRNLNRYNQLGAKAIKEKLSLDGEEPIGVPYYLPYIVVIVDELADLMMVASKEVEGSVIRLSQKSRAAGVHLVFATQRPSVDVITGLIKANMPTRIAFKVASKVDSRTILDASGAEKLIGEGDMLLLMKSELTRAQCTYVSDGELRRVIEYVKQQSVPEYTLDFSAGETAPTQLDAETDELFEDAVRIILESRRGSVSSLQRKLGIGYCRAARLVDMMERYGVVGPEQGSKAREVLMTLEQWESMKRK